MRGMIKPTISLQELRSTIGHRAKSAPAHRFWGLHVHVVKLDTVEASYLEAKRNNGAPGSDGETFEGIGVSLNTEKTRIVTITDERAVFAFLGFEFRWVPSAKTGRWYPCMTPRPTKITSVLRNVRDSLRTSRHLSVHAAVAQVNPILRGWVNYFRVGNASQAFNKVQYHVERKVRRFAAKQRKRSGFGWKRWSSEMVYGSWGLYRDYHLAYASAKARAGRTDA
jgi:RNA-directed DNA polymerase